jgi:hypothetical protein
MTPFTAFIPPLMVCLPGPSRFLRRPQLLTWVQPLPVGGISLSPLHHLSTRAFNWLHLSDVDRKEHCLDYHTVSPFAQQLPSL